MKLTEFNNKTSSAATALKEHYNLPFKLDKLTLSEGKAMRQKVRGLLAEAKQSDSFHTSQNSPSYMKLVFMEQALTTFISDIYADQKRNIVVENEEVEKSQVVLAAQDMVDSVQKMLEQVSDMMVKELPALVDSVQSEIGVTESESFSASVSEALTSLTAALTQSKAGLQSALNGITGQGDMSADAFGAEEMPGAEMPDADLSAEEEFPAAEEPELPPEEPEAIPVPGVGRARR